jgi:hypothetical protein
MSKRPALLLIAILAVSSHIIVESVFAQSITKPSVPEFTVASGAQNETIIITIKNQPFTSYTDSDGDVVRLYYTVRAERNFEEYTEVHPASDSAYTTIITSLQTYPLAEIWSNSSSGEELDFQLSLNAKIGKVSWYFGEAGMRSYFEGEVSGWSETQTLTLKLIPIPSPSPESTPSPEPAISQETALILGIVAFVAVFVFGLVLLYRIKRK